MKLVLILFAAVSLAEISIWLPIAWRGRRLIAAFLAILLGALSGWLLANQLNLAAVIFTIITLYRMLNLARLAEGRMHADFLFHSTRKTSLWLIFYQVLVLGADRLVALNHINILTCFYIVAASQLVVALVLLSSTLRHIKTTKPPFLENNLATSELPTLTVAIPARNETKDLEECLQSLLASSYPKLEILVLDDCSQNKRTPEIIRNFAQEGVRFISGKTPPDSWLAKNYAYKQLADEANGEILLFCGVDCHFTPDSLLSMITNMKQKNKTMVSIMPQNVLKDPRSVLVQPSRYAWELALPRRMLGRPPVLSTCWLITRDVLKAAGGFQAVSRKAVPESYLAKFSAKHDDGYSFMRSDAAMKLLSQKTFDEQFSTAIRTRYPQLHRRPELVAVTMLAEFITLVWPLLVGVLSLVSQEWALAAISLTGFLMVTIVYASIVNLTYQKLTLVGLLVLPFAAIYDICLLNYSMWRYEFSEVLWKGRNICMPIMHTIDRLPKLDR